MLFFNLVKICVHVRVCMCTCTCVRVCVRACDLLLCVTTLTTTYFPAIHSFRKIIIFIEGSFGISSYPWHFSECQSQLLAVVIATGFSLSESRWRA